MAAGVAIAALASLLCCCGLRWWHRPAYDKGWERFNKLRTRVESRVGPMAKTFRVKAWAGPTREYKQDHRGVPWSKTDTQRWRKQHFGTEKKPLPGTPEHALEQAHVNDLIARKQAEELRKHNERQAYYRNRNRQQQARSSLH